MRRSAAPQPDDVGWLENPRRRSRVPDGRELWTYRELAAFLALRDLKARYKQAAFGVAWAVVQPLAGAVVITLVFGRVARLESDGLPYLPFAFVGFAVWSYFSTSLERIATSLVENSALVTKVYFPRILAPLAAALPGLAELLIALVMAVGLLLVEGVLDLRAATLTLPFWILADVAVAFCIGLLMATLNVQYRDVNSATGLVVQLLFFASPVAYSSSLVDEQWRWLYYVNPMAAVIDGFRWSLLGTPWPGRWALISLATGSALLAVGLRYFTSAERRFADVI